MLSLTKRGVQISLGLLWLFDGLLQLQPRMFTHAFANQVIAPAAQGQPGLVSGPIHFGLQVFLSQPALFNSLFALTQLILGALILWPRTIKLGLSLSIGWALIVWIFGEGYGGLLSGHTSILMGAPGAVILYAVLAMAVMPTKASNNSTKRKPQAAYWLALVWLVIWVGGGVYQLLPGQNSAMYFSSTISSNASQSPSWLTSLDNNSAKFIADLSNQKQLQASMSSMSMASNSGYTLVLLAAIIQVAIGVGVLFKGNKRKLAIYLGCILSFWFWIVGQNLGGLFSGFATDLGTAPVLIIMGLTILGITNLDQRLSKLGHRMESIFVGKTELIYEETAE